MDKKEFPKIRGISRLDYKTTCEGWFARYTRDGVTFNKTFPDSEYGSAEAGLEEAKKWHEEARSLLPPLNRKEYAEIKKGNNTSGHTGVYRTFQRKKGEIYYYWVASWSEFKGKPKFKRFYVKTLGEEKAKEMAVKAREEAMANLEKEWPDDFWEYRRRQENLTRQYLRDVFGYEGEEKYAIHKHKERDRDLRNQKVEKFLDEHGELFCEICNFSFQKEYGEIGKGLIEVHHMTPLFEMSANHKTKLSELICVCSNCHLVIHSGDHAENIRKMRFIFNAKKKQ